MTNPATNTSTMNGAENSAALVATGNEALAPRARQAPGLPGSELAELDQHPQWTTLSRLPLRLRVGVALPRFKVRDLLTLACGELVQSAWSSTTDVPVVVGSAQLSWAEFEVVEQRMAIRITRLA